MAPQRMRTSRGRAASPSVVHNAALARTGAVRMLDGARAAIAEAATTTVPTERYAAAHLAALRGAAAVLATRTQPTMTAARRPTSAWRLLADVAPELAEWAGCFAAGAGKRAAAQAGLRSAVTARDADDLLRDAQTFLALVEVTIGVLSFPVDRAG